MAVCYLLFRGFAQQFLTEIQTINGSEVENPFTLADGVLVMQSGQNMLQVFEGSEFYEFQH